MYIDIIAYLILAFIGICGVIKGLKDDEALDTFIGMLLSAVVLIKLILISSMR